MRGVVVDLPEEPEAPRPGSAYLWDQWKARAIAAGMPEATASAGRALIRECYQHGWNQYMGPAIDEICGYGDVGAGMLAFGTRHPELAREIWRHLEADDAGNAPRSPDPSPAVRELVTWVFYNKGWPEAWPLAEGSAR